MNRFLLTTSAILGVSSLCANGTQAQTSMPLVDGALSAINCNQSQQVIGAHVLRESVILNAGLAFDREILKALESGSLGTLAATRTNGPLFELLGKVTLMLSPATPIGMATSQRYAIGNLSKLPAREHAIQFLNGATSDVTVTCLGSSTSTMPLSVQGAAPVQMAAIAPTPTLKPTPNPKPAANPVIVPIVIPVAVPVPAPRPRKLIVADSKNDLIKVPRDRAFATIGFEDDRVADTSLFNMSIALAHEPMRLVSFNTKTAVSWTPFLQYNRRTAPAGRDQVNDLTLGSSFIVRNPLRVGGAIGFASVAYQTDDQTRAQVWIGDALVDFPRLGLCTRKDILGWDMRCNVSLVMDYADVNDPGASRRLAILDRYLRIGPNISMVAEQRFPIGMISMNMSYFGRYDTLSGEATGDLFSIGTGFRPSPSSNFSLQTSYTVGTTLNTLVDVDKVSVRLGYRM